jgi:hypothetical protein
MLSALGNSGLHGAEMKEPEYRVKKPKHLFWDAGIPSGFVAAGEEDIFTLAVGRRASFLLKSRQPL